MVTHRSLPQVHLGLAMDLITMNDITRPFLLLHHHMAEFEASKPRAEPMIAAKDLCCVSNEKPHWLQVDSISDWNDKCCLS